MSYEIIDTIVIRVLKKFDKCNKLNPIKIKIDEIIADLAKYQKSKYLINNLINNLLFTSAILNDTKNINITKILKY